MRGWVLSALLGAVGTLWGGQAAGGPTSAEEPEGLRERIQERARHNLARLPDYICLQTVERSRKASATADFEPFDTLRLEVGLGSDKEMFAWRGANRFTEAELAELVGKGTIGTGNFGLHAQAVLVSGAADHEFVGEEEIGGRRAFRYDYEVPEERSRYKVRVLPYEAVVGYKGSFWVDAGTLDLLRLEVRAEEIPHGLGLLRTADVMNYTRATIGTGEFLLPQSSRLSMVEITGAESRNVTEFTGCRQFTAEAKLIFGGQAAVGEAPPSTFVGTLRLPPNLLLDLELDSDIPAAKAAVGDPVRAVLARPLKEGERIVVPQGAVVHGRLVRLERSSMPVDHYVVGLQFDTLEFGGQRTPFAATMEKVEGGSGLIRQQKRLDPVFTKGRRARLDILVEERPKGQGILHWEARRPIISRGLRMKWSVEPQR